MASKHIGNRIASTYMGAKDGNLRNNEVVKAPSIAQHRKKLGDREKFDQFERKDSRRSHQALKAQARRDRKSQDPDGPLSPQTLTLLIIGFVLFIASAAYLIVTLLLPATRS